MRSLRRLLGPFSGQVRHARSEALRFSPSGSRGGYFSNLQPSRTVLRSSGWTLALAAVGGGLAYAFGVNQTGGDSRFQSVGRVGAAAAPRYATQQQLEKVKTMNDPDLRPSYTLDTHYPLRPCGSCDRRSEKMPSRRTRRIFASTATQSGLPSTSPSCRLPWPTPNRQMKFRI